ncbi:MAG: hypothetical protein ACLFUJ_05300 [Phycisphaerae bacterium]
MKYNKTHCPLTDALRFSVTDEGGYLRFEWIQLEGLPESPKINPILMKFFKDRCLEDVDREKLEELLSENAGRRYMQIAMVIEEYCNYLLDLHRQGLAKSSPPAGRFVESSCSLRAAGQPSLPGPSLPGRKNMMET